MDRPPTTKKNAEHLRITLATLGFENLPREKHEFALLLVNLLSELEAFLDLVIERIEEPPFVNKQRTTRGFNKRFW